MDKIVGVTFKENGRIKYFYIDNINIKIGYNVLVKTDRGIEFGKIATSIHQIDTKQLNEKLGTVEKIATKKDYYTHRENMKEANKALKKIRDLVQKYKLDMNIIDANYTFDRGQLMFKFYASSRVDFRELTKELAAIYKTRIELRQIGVRDKAQEIGGYGMCGRKLCCSKFLKEFDSVSISMAKNQNLSLNPNKINGICGRLLCCLKYEDECYKKLKTGIPKVGQTIDYKGKKGKVISVNILRRNYTLELSDGNIVKVELDESSK